MSFFTGLIAFNLIWLTLTFLAAKLNAKIYTRRNKLINNSGKMTDDDMARFAADLPRTLVFIAINALVIFNAAAIAIYLVNR